jgi:hypothetical protein
VPKSYATPLKGASIKGADFSSGKMQGVTLIDGRVVKSASIDNLTLEK